MEEERTFGKYDGVLEGVPGDQVVGEKVAGVEEKAAGVEEGASVEEKGSRLKKTVIYYATMIKRQ